MGFDLKTKNIVVFGFGAQGKAHALNLKDSGCMVKVCLPESSLSIAEAKNNGFEVITNAIVAAKNADILALMVPDSVQPRLYKEIEDFIPRNSALIFAHGLNILYKIIVPREDLDIILAAPNAQGNMVRQMYLNKEPLPVMLAVNNNVSGMASEILKSYALAIGASKDTIMETTFQEETETDLFSEQALTVGGLLGLIRATFETMVEAGYSSKIAYYCCTKEVQILADMFARLGIFETLRNISDTAKFGALSRGPKIINENVKKDMKKVLEEIQNQTFIKDLLQETGENKFAKTKELTEELKHHEIEQIREKINQS